VRRLAGGPLAAALAVVALVVGCTSEPETASPAPDTTSASVERSDELMQRVLPADEPGCSAAVGIEGEVVWAAARGVADLATGRPIETSTTFAIGAVTAQFTATAVLLLVHDGELSLDDPLSTWVPGLPPWAGSVTVGQAMHHVSGIPDYVDRRLASGVGWTEPRTVDDSLAEIAAVPDLAFPPGDRFQYSNSNYFLLSEVARAVAGRPVQDVVRERIVEPLGLAMEFDPSGWDPDTTDPSSARGYVRDPSTGEWEPAGVRWEVNGDAGIQTTPSELVRWADNYRTGRVGGDRLLADVMADAADAGAEAYGAGIFEADDGHLGHGSEAPGHLAYIFVSADRSTAIAVACNGERGAQSATQLLARALRTEWAR
jgi:CubicO group peptidase (beta-lactamase class C family)